MNSRSSLMDLARRYQLAMILQTLVELDVAPSLASGESLENLARRVGVKPAALRSMVQALGAVAGVFSDAGDDVTETGRELLESDSPLSVAPMVDHEARQQSLWHDLNAVLRSTVPITGQQDVEMAVDAERLAILLRAMQSMNRELVDQVAHLDAWTGRQQFVDAAGGHGEFLARILQAHAERQGLVLDQATAQRECDATFARYDVASRARFLAQDLTSDDPFNAVDADAILFCRCLHNFAPRTIESILESARSAIRRAGGGVCVVVERHLDRDGRRLVPRESALFSGYMAVNCIGGHVPRTDWMVQALQPLGATKLVRLGDLHTAFVCEVSEP